MKLRIGSGTPHVVISTRGPFTMIAFRQPVSVGLLSIDPLQDLFYIGVPNDENWNPVLKAQVTFFTIPGDLHGIVLGAPNLRVELVGIIRPSIYFTLDNYGIHNTVMIKENEFATLNLTDHAGSTTFDLSQQPGISLHTRTKHNTLLIFSRMMGPVCIACSDQEATEVYQPCGHWGVCKACSLRSQCTKCPICRGESEQMISLYVA
jgi:hypothetical protein